MSNILPLQLCYATQTGFSKSTDWAVCEGNTKKELYTLPGKWNEKDVMTAIHLGRKFELDAFNTGVKYGKTQEKEMTKEAFERMQKTIDELENMNLRLSAQLERFIIGRDEEEKFK
jgi:hypothetical protein